MVKQIWVQKMMKLSYDRTYQVYLAVKEHIYGQDSQLPETKWNKDDKILTETYIDSNNIRQNQ